VHQASLIRGLGFVDGLLRTVGMPPLGAANRGLQPHEYIVAAHRGLQPHKHIVAAHQGLQQQEYIGAAHQFLIIAVYN